MGGQLSFLQKILEMKNIILSIMLFSISHLIAQPHTHWLNYTFSHRAFEIVIKGENVFVGTLGGLVKYNKLTGNKTFLNRANSNLADNNVLGLSQSANGAIYMGGKKYGFGILSDSLCTIYNQANSDLPFDQYNVRVKTDKNGNIWIASFRWMIKYDGHNWKTWLTGSDLAAFPIISDFFIADDGIVWIYCTDGLCKIENDIFTVVDNLGHLGVGNVRYGCVREDSDGNIWIAVEKEGLFKYDGNLTINYNASNSSLPTNEIFYIDFDRNNKLWLATLDGLILFKEDDCEVFQPLGQNKGLVSIKCDDDNVIWCGTIDGGKLLKFDGSDFVSIEISNSPLKSNWVISLIEDNEGSILTGSVKNTIKFSKDSIYQVFNKATECGVLDNSKALWLAFNKGDTTFLKISNDNSEIFDTTNSVFRISSNWINSMDVDIYNNIWISTRGNGLFKYNGTEFIRYNMANSGLPSNYVFKTVFDHNNNMWCGTTDGLVKFDGENWTVWNTQNSSIPTNLVFALITDSNNSIWFSCLDEGGFRGVEVGGGITRFDGSNMTTYNIFNSDLQSNTVFDLLEYNKKIWIGTFGAGLNVFEYNNNEWDYYNVTNSGIANNDINKLLRDSKGNFWIANIWGGVSVFNPDSVIQTTGLINKKIAKDDSNFLLKIYPNPAKKELFVDLNLDGEKIKKVRIYDLKGNLIETIQNITSANKNPPIKINLNLQTLKNQIYILSLETDKGNIINTKFVITK